MRKNIPYHKISTEADVVLPEIFSELRNNIKKLLRKSWP